MARQFVEAKDNKHSVGAGMQQALEYAEMLDAPFAYSAKGDAFLELSAAWNDTLIDGRQPNDDEIVQEVRERTAGDR